MPPKHKILSSSEPQAEPPAKIPKLVDPAIDPEADWPSIHVAHIDKHFTKPGRQRAILEEKDLKLIEACFTHRMIGPFVQQQSDLYRAQAKYSEPMLSFRVKHSDWTFKPVKAKELAHALLQLLVDNKMIAESLPHLHDAILYRVAFLAAFDAFSGNSIGNSKNAYVDLGTIIGEEKNINGFLDSITRASERHLSRPDHRSILWTHDNTLPQSIVAVPAPDMSQSGQLSSSSGSAVLPNAPKRAMDVHGTEFIEEKVKDFITTFEDLGNIHSVVPWDRIDAISTSVKEEWELDFLLRQTHKNKTRPCITPGGVLLHGVPGTGKTEVALSLCQQLKGTLVRIDKNVEGSLRGQMPATIKTLLKEIVRLSSLGAVVVLVDEAEAVMGSADSEHARDLQALLKDNFNMLMNANAPIYVIATTNNPHAIDMANWSRRLHYKIHIGPASEQGRQHIFEHVLSASKLQLSEQQMNEIVAETDGLTAHDIRHVVKTAELRASKSALAVERWVEFKSGVDVLLRPAEAGENASVVGSLRELRPEDISRVVLPEITFEDLLTYIKTGRNGGKVVPSYSADELEFHRSWNRQINGG